LFHGLSEIASTFKKKKVIYFPFLSVGEGNKVCGSIKWAVDRGLPTVDD
jgi:hypothetical protein